MVTTLSSPPCAMYLISLFGGHNKLLDFAVTVGTYTSLGMLMLVVCFVATKQRAVPKASNYSYPTSQGLP